MSEKKRKRGNESHVDDKTYNNKQPYLEKEYAENRKLTHEEALKALIDAMDVIKSDSESNSDVDSESDFDSDDIKEESTGFKDAMDAYSEGDDLDSGLKEGEKGEKGEEEAIQGLMDVYSKGDDLDSGLKEGEKGEEESDYENDFLSFFQVEQESLRKNYDIVKYSKIYPLDRVSIKYLKYMLEDYVYVEPNDALPTPFLLIGMHSSLRIYYDEILEKPYYEVLPCPINMWRLKPAPQHTTSCVSIRRMDTLSSGFLAIPTPDKKPSDININKYFDYIIKNNVFTKTKKKNPLDISQIYLKEERRSIVHTKQKEFYINKIYSKYFGIYLCNDITFELPINYDDPDVLDDYVMSIEHIRHEMKKKGINYKNIQDKFGRVTSSPSSPELYNFITYKRGQNITECLYFMAYCHYTQARFKTKNIFKLEKIEDGSFIISSIDLFSILTYFKNCNKFVCTDVSCENARIMNKTLKKLLEDPIKEVAESAEDELRIAKARAAHLKIKDNAMKKIKSMRSIATETGLRGGKTKKRNKSKKTKKIQKSKNKRKTR
jgi:ribosomal protein S13